MVFVQEGGEMTTKIKGKVISSGTAERLKQEALQATPRVSNERLIFLAEVYKQAEGAPPVIKRAKLFERVLSGMTIYIDENAIVGSMTQYLCGTYSYPEASTEWMEAEKSYYTHLGEGIPGEEEKKLISQAVDYWQDRCIVSRTKEIFRQKHPEVDLDEILAAGVFRDAIHAPNWGARICVDYGKVLNKGLNGIIAEAEKELVNLPIADINAIPKREFLNAVIITLKAVIAFAHRYAILAEELANNEVNLQRKAELERISQACRWVPQNPARSFYEALQSFWFIHLATLIDSCSSGHSPGRFPVYMYPFYKRDKKAGRITPEEAIELLELLFVKFNEITAYRSKDVGERTMGNMFQNLSLGGYNREGEDATNELDFLILEAQKRLQTVQPTLSLLYHDKMPTEFLIKAVELVKTGIGMPAFFNADLNIQRLLDHGVSLEEAREHAIIGCIQTGPSHAAGSLTGEQFNTPKLLELALNNGKDPLTGRQIGPQTGEPLTFNSYSGLYKAVEKQLQYFLPLLLDFELTGYSVAGLYFPSPFISALIDDCIGKKLDLNCGGSRYTMDGTEFLGVVDLGDSLTGIKKLVFEEKRITMSELLQALRANFDGYEELHHILLEAPKYGNDDDYVDRIVKDWYQIAYREHQKFSNQFGRRRRPLPLSVSAHFVFGKLTGALPSGRKAGEPLADGSVSASPGRDVKGPTALIKSAAKVIDSVSYGCSLLNMKFNPHSLQTNEQMQKFISLIKSYMDLKGHHVQFNIVSAETLKDAQLHPANYRNLIVRVAGFSAYFIYLDPIVQDQLIKRTELRL